MKFQNLLKILLFFILLNSSFSKENLLLLKTYEDQNISGWLMSEKYDGIRAFWNGVKLQSRNGNEIYAPEWFLKDFPPFKIDGELWSKRDDFENISSITSELKPSKRWQELKFYIFEVPDQKGNLSQRLEILQNYLLTHKNTTIRIIKQQICKDKTHLQNFLDEVVKNKGEGVVLRDPNAPYIAQRTNKALKVKKFYDSECKVIAHHKGSGKFKDVLGSLTCNDENITFKIGSGFSDKQRANPPKIGQIITYKYQSLTKNKKPRFPVFLRIRKDAK